MRPAKKGSGKVNLRILSNHAQAGYYGLILPADNIADDHEAAPAQGLPVDPPDRVPALGAEPGQGLFHGTFTGGHVTWHETDRKR
jgi:hypothetical protein